MSRDRDAVAKKTDSKEKEGEKRPRSRERGQRTTADREVKRRGSSDRRSKSGDRSRRRSRSRSRDRAAFRKRSPSDADAAIKREPEAPLPVRIHIGRLTRNVNKDHLTEIFANFGTVQLVDIQFDRNHSKLNKGYCYVQYATQEEAENAMKHMDGGQIDGQEVTASPCLKMNWPEQRRNSPMRGGGRRGGPPPMRNNQNRWRDMRNNRRRSPDRRRSPIRRR